jgi:hypothetical protein
MIPYKDIKDVPTLFECLSAVRIRKLFTWRESVELAEQILGRKFRTETEAINALHQHYNQPEEPKECHCEPANGTRWMVSPVLIHYNPQGQQFDYESIIRQVASEVMRECDIKFVFTDSERDAHIVISNGIIDGANGTLGQAYVPVSGDDMAACGPMCGDILIDEDEDWNIPFFKTVFTHELLHAIGVPHSTDRRSIMYFQYQGPRDLHPLDIAELLRRYPRREFA